MYWERQTDNCSIISDASLLPAIEQNCFWLCRYRTRVVFPSPECYNSCLGQWPHLKIQPCCESIKSEGCRCPKLAAMVHLQWHLQKVENVTYVRIIPIWRQLWKHTFAISPTRPVHQIGHSSPFIQSEPGIQRQWREVESSSQEWSSISFCSCPALGRLWDHN